MSKQLIKSLMMVTLVLGLALAATVVSANGQSSHLITVDVPFDFIVADQTLPSGKYTVRKATNDGKGLSISSVDGKSSVARLSNSVVATDKARNGRLVFHRYGQQYFLAEVWSGDNYHGRQLIKSEKELQLEREQSLIASKSDSGKGRYEVVEVVVSMFR